jgi:uncharacterized protein YgfB (UPF0149 family)
VGKIAVMDKQIDFRDISDALARSNAEMGAAECHGMCCGVLCASGSLNVELMVAQLAGANDSDSSNSGDAADQLSVLLNATIVQLNGGEFDLRLLLPDDEDPLAERSVALGLWCQGFVMGLSAGGVSEETELSKDSRELLLDFSSIASGLNDDQDPGQNDGDEEEEEVAYAELEEYVRVGVLLIREELKSTWPEGLVH